MALITEPRLLTWTIPTPQGLWYQAIVVIDRGLFVTPKIDATTMEALKKAASVGTEELVRLLTDHGRFKQPQFFTWDGISAIRQNDSTGTIEIDGNGRSASVTVPDRERLEKLGRVLAKTWHSQSNQP